MEFTGASFQDGRLWPWSNVGTLEMAADRWSHELEQMIKALSDELEKHWV